jgi:hypothetical protein
MVHATEIMYEQMGVLDLTKPGLARRKTFSCPLITVPKSDADTASDMTPDLAPGDYMDFTNESFLSSAKCGLSETVRNDLVRRCMFLIHWVLYKRCDSREITLVKPRKVYVTVESWISRLTFYVPVETMAVAMIYLSRLYNTCLDTNSDGFRINEDNIHHTLMTCVIIAYKYMNDVVYTTKQWVFLASNEMTDAEIIKYERTVLKLLKWRVHVTRETYIEFLRNGLGMECGSNGVL